MNHEKWIELADLYAAGALETGDAAEFYTHLESGCELCQFRILENETALAGLVQSLPALQVPETLKSKVMDSLTEEFEPMVFQPSLNPAWAVLVWLLISGGVLWGWKATSLKRHTLEFKRMESAMMSRDQTKSADMQSTDPAKHIFAKVMWNPKGGCLFMTMGLPKPDRSKTYQLWQIVGDQKISAGIFEVDEHGCGVLVMKDFLPKSSEKMAVTLEPAGGVSAPTGPIVLLGAL